jgi:hypothetical protein
MSIKSNLVKMAIKCSPKVAVIWVANKVLKGIAELSDFIFDLDLRTAYVQMTLYGEAEPIEVWLDDFAIINEEDGSKKFIVQQAKSNKPWLQNIFAHIVGKAWKIPVIPQLAPYMDLIAELLKAENFDGPQEIPVEDNQEPINDA